MIKRITKRFTPKQYLAELLLGLTALLGLYLIVAWSSYTPLDNSWSTASFQTETINKAGAFGAWLIDAFFVFLGYVGHLIPFVIFIVPIYLLKTKAVHSLSATRIALRSFGFIALIVGLTMMATLLLSNTNYYLAGGVFGGSLVVNLYPTIGKFGCILVGFICAVVGFIFCSGASLIRLIVKFYHWLTMKNQPAEEEHAEHTSVDDLEQIVIEAPQQLTFSDSQLETESAEDKKEDESGNAFVKPEQLINISGLSSPSASEPADVEKLEDKFKGFTVESDNLPNVSISAASSVELPTKEDFSATWKNPQVNHQSVDESDDIFEENVMPKVSLKTPENTTALYPTYDEP